MAYGQALSPDVLVKAYPEQLASQDGTSILWRDGAKQPLSDGLAKTFEQKLKNSSLSDQLSLPYPKGPLSRTPGPEDDPGRFRNSSFFDKMYGGCEKGEAQAHLVTISWVGGERLRVTSINGVADRLRIIADELKRLPNSLRRFTYPSAGTFACRTVKDTGKRSMHGYGAAIECFGRSPRRRAACLPMRVKASAPPGGFRVRPRRIGGATVQPRSGRVRGG